MAKAKGKKMVTEAQAALAAFDKKFEGKTLNETQQAAHDKERAELKRIVDEETFKRLGNVRINKALNAIEGLGKLARLPHTKEQIDRMKKAFQEALSVSFGKFETKAEKSGKAVREIV